MKLRCWLKLLLTLALALPIVYCVLVGVRGLVNSMGDAAGAAFVGRVGTVCLACWAISLVGLLILLAVVQLIEPSPKDDTDK
jgi:hypothetical protein